MYDWLRTKDELPPENVFVNTKIDDCDGVRNVQTLRRQGNLWFTEGPNAMYVYYTPTHWQFVGAEVYE